MVYCTVQRKWFIFPYLYSVNHFDPQTVLPAPENNTAQLRVSERRVCSAVSLLYRVKFVDHAANFIYIFIWLLWGPMINNFADFAAACLSILLWISTFCGGFWWCVVSQVG